jgi:hypothetical protein
MFVVTPALQVYLLDCAMTWFKSFSARKTCFPETGKSTKTERTSML